MQLIKLNFVYSIHQIKWIAHCAVGFVVLYMALDTAFRHVVALPLEVWVKRELI